MSATAISAKVRVRILRQDHPNSESHWDEFDVPYQENMNVISLLMAIQRNPVTAEGRKVKPPTWDGACLEEVCGSCTMNINGMIRQACTALIEDIAEDEGGVYHLKLEPMKKFPLVRDLVVDRTKMFEGLKKIKGWVPIDGSFDLGMAPPQDDAIRQVRYALSRCMTCGCCMEACPQVNDKSSFVGPQTMAQALLFNLNPVGKTLQDERLEYLTGEEGITGCGNAQNCVKVCPKGVPLTRAIAELNRDTTMYKLRRWIGLLG